MERNTLEKFFTGKSFVIPTYQRDYAWTKQNIDDLLDDIAETIETNTSHYIGTFILSRKPAEDTYSVVDGQQRLTTLTMLLNTLVNQLPSEQRIIYRNTFIQDVTKKRWRLELADYNRTFFAELLESKVPVPDSKSQKLLKDAYEYIGGRILEIQKRNDGALEAYLVGVKQLEVMEFIESDEGKAIRIFQTVNDRGRPLAVVEKTKALLIYYSNRFLAGKHDNLINESFGNIFRVFTALKDITEADDTRVPLLSSANFTEDSVMRYHFLSFPNDYYDFKPTTDYVLDGFLKRSLRNRQTKLSELSEFINIYVSDLKSFFDSLLKLAKRVQCEPRYFKLFCVLGLSTHLYPLAIRLQGRELLDVAVGKGNLTFADLIEIADVRVYKTRGTNPAKDISRLACDAVTKSEKEIAASLANIVSRFMDDGLFASALSGSMYGNEAILHILLQHGEACATEKGRAGYTVAELIDFMRSQPTIEHIFAQTPGFTFPGRGFETQEQYLGANDRLGNLCLLEKALNSRCQEKTPEQKLEDVKLYKESRFDTTRSLVAEVAAGGTPFNAKAVDARTRKLADFVKVRWPLWDNS
ncbi:MAG: DUF262 domain-containing HNH endonuclease family protein [Planctomycetes bacterium]|jgi:uncharacterized protein with ParB-like and HNH nuclease domain|nr:DUF262 domain-containing HNH endonuclease family protein [Planctomycetota bacterium]